MPPQIAGLCPLIQVFDMLESVRFYRDRLGFEIAHQSPHQERPYPHFNWAWLKRGDAELMLNTAYEADERPPARDTARQVAHDDTTLYFACPDVDGAYELLKAAGLNLKPPRVAPYGMKQLSFHDPDGYGICLQWRTQVANKTFEPGTYVEDGSFVFVRNPSPEELAASHQLMVTEIGSNVASPDVLEKVCDRNPMAWWLLFRSTDESRTNAEPVGFCGYLPLNADGFAALKAGTLKARDPDLTLIAPHGEDPVALYLWAIVAHGLSDIAGKLVGHAIGLDLYESLPMFGTIGTEAGLAALRRSSKSANDAAALEIGSVFAIKLPPKHLEHQRKMKVWEGKHRRDHDPASPE
jgi:glyoxylase I family protein